MVRRVALMVLVGMGLVAAATGAQEKHGFVCADSGLKRLVEFSPEGEIVWEFKGPYCYDLTLLPNDNILFCHNGGRTSVVREI
ncbi:MAG: hypothetical protein GY851_10955, partial [bacterium]|nr:hypothetical protein [bacterium]